jgi:DeoR family transcriptional regulator of aga operon
MSAKTEARSDQIMKVLLRAGTVSVEDLVAQTGSSAPSIRRDLTRLEQRGLIRRTHGGAGLVEPLLYEPFRHDTSFQAREMRHADEKRRIGLAAAELVQQDEIIGISAGTTTTQVGRSLRHRAGVHVVTNAINIGMELCNQPSITTTLTGGTLAWAWAFALAGPQALLTLEGLRLDKVFLSVTGLSLEKGATTLEVEEAIVSRKMLQEAKQVIVVADSSKIGKSGPGVICSLAQVHVLVTDTNLSGSKRKQFEKQGLQVICC